MGQSTGRVTLGLSLLATLAACANLPTESTGAPAGKRGGVYLGASGYSVAQPDSTMLQEAAATDTVHRGVYLGASGY